ncbi:unnamed protein product, partial [Meganyctiphanes norvegica]
MGILIPVLVCAAVVAALLKALGYFDNRPKANNPFSHDTQTPPKPKVIDQKQRDAVLKQSYSAEKVPSELDAVIIGSGIGGMTVAAIMAKAGKKVLVLEQHDQAGGCCHTFIDKGYEFDVGIHYIGELGYQSESKTLLDQITKGQLQWADLDEKYDEIVFAEDGKEIRKYPVSLGKDVWQNDLKRRFPEEEENIDKFFKLLESVRRGFKNSMVVKLVPLWVVKLLDVTGLIHKMTNFYKWNAKSVKEVVWNVTPNQELRDIFCYCFGDYGTPPSKAGFPMQATLLTHWSKSASYPVGGASEIAFNIIPVIEEAGGKVLVRAEVTKIVIGSNGTVCGVEVKKGREVTTINTPMVISNAGVFNTFERLLPQEIATSSRLWPIVKGSEHGIGAISVFIGINASSEEIDIIHKQNYWVFNKNNIDKAFNDYAKLSREEALDVDFPLMFVSFPSTKDPEWNKKYSGHKNDFILSLKNLKLALWTSNNYLAVGDLYHHTIRLLGPVKVDPAKTLVGVILESIHWLSLMNPLSNHSYCSQGKISNLDRTPNKHRSVCNPTDSDPPAMPETSTNGNDDSTDDLPERGWVGCMGTCMAL